jgi:hypothetical protein
MPDLTFEESLRIGWFIWWRTYVITSLADASAAGVVIFVWNPSNAEPITILSIVVVVFGGIIFVVLPYITRMMMRKRFSGFHLEIVRDLEIFGDDSKS